MTGSGANGDNIFVGIRGDFGDFRIGEVPDATGYGQINDILGGSDIDGEDTGLSYTGSFGGFTFGANWSPEGSSDRICLLYTSPSPRDKRQSRMPSSA